MKRLGAVINIATNVNANSNIPLNGKEMLTSFSNHVATRDGGEEADIDNVGDKTPLSE